MGCRSRAEASRCLRHLGRNFELPWATADLRAHLFYLDHCNVFVLPVAHLLLRGLVRGLWVYALQSKAPPANHPVIFNTAAHRAVAVCTPCPLYF